MIISCGEALIDFLPKQNGTEQNYQPVPGGSPFNVAIAMARLNGQSGFFGHISSDFFGDQLASTLAENGVNTDLVKRLDQPSTLAFVSTPENGEPQYAFFFQNAADRAISEADLPSSLNDEVEALHFGSFSTAVEPCGSSLEMLMKRERENRTITFDPNVRPSLIGDKDAYMERLMRLISLSHLVKVSQADLDWLYPNRAAEDIATEWLELGPVMVVITNGEKGVRAWRKNSDVVAVAAEQVQVVDTVGAGDSFMAGFLVALSERNSLTKTAMADMDQEMLEESMMFANKVAAKTCGKAGADSPHRDQLSQSKAA